MKTLTERIKDKIERSGDAVFMRSDFKRLGGYEQVGRALKALIDAKFLVRTGYGVLARTTISVLSGKLIPRLTPMGIACVVLRKLGIEPQPSRAARAYSEYRTTSIPVREKINVGKSRIRRKIGFNGRFVEYERGSNERW